MDNCMLCPRNCRCDRSTGQKGYCGESSSVRIARAALHFWEEPVISGEKGSGAVFFTGCNLKCIFCQNASIAASEVGKEVSIEALAEIFLKLQTEGANNINLVTASHFVPQVARSIRMARKLGLTIPIVYNTSSYEKPETLQMLDGLVDIYLPDLKYMDSKLAKAYSKAEDYPKIAKAAIDEMYRQAGKPVYDEETGLMRKGVIVRHLVMPGAVGNAKAVIDYLYETYGDAIFISLMNQYTPMREFTEYPELNRKVTKREYEKVIQYALDLGIENAFIQEGETAQESFIPAFDLTGV
ncbi:MAG: radical SAM protein [Lachnospiraceae bacterium]|nr:radical SAM protein [Lachnospiraceae bacterium]